MRALVYVGPLCFMVALLAVLLAAAGFIKPAAVGWTVVGCVYVFLLSALIAGLASATKRAAAERQRVMARDMTIARVEIEKRTARTNYLLVHATGAIRAGDLVKVDVERATCARVTALPTLGTEEGVQ